MDFALLNARVDEVNPEVLDIHNLHKRVKDLGDFGMFDVPCDLLHASESPVDGGLDDERHHIINVLWFSLERAPKDELCVFQARGLEALPPMLDFLADKRPVPLLVEPCVPVRKEHFDLEAGLSKVLELGDCHEVAEVDPSGDLIPAVGNRSFFP